MPLLSRTHIFQFILLLALTFSCIVMAQEKEHYSGPYKIGDYLGEADFAFSMVGNDTVIDGPFLMQKISSTTLLKEGDSSFSFVGAFSEGKADGYWKFQTGNFKSGEAGKLVDYRYQLDLNGIQLEASGDLVEGKLDGEWSIGRNKIKNSEIESNLFKSVFQYSDGTPQSSFRVEDESFALVGRVLRDGLAHDEWTLFENSTIGATETWFFEDGLLKKVELNQQGEKVDIPFFTSSTPEMVTVPLNDGILHLINDLILSKASLTSEVTKLLRENDSQYRLINDILNSLGNAELHPNILVQLPHYPLDSLEVAEVEIIIKNVEAATTISESLLTNSHLNIVKRSDTKAAFLIDVVDEITEQYLNPIQKFKIYQEQDLLRFIDSDVLIAQLWSNGLPSKSIEVKGAAPYLGPTADNYDFSVGGISSIKQASVYTLQSLESISSTLESHVREGKRIQNLVELEEGLLNSNNELEKILTTQIDSLPLAHKEVLNAIKSFAEEQLKTYSEMDGEPEKIEFGKRLEACFEGLKELSQNVVNQPNEWAEIQELYTDQVWNPFMATIMDESQKKRITSAYSEVLVPYFFNQIKTELDCDSASQLLAEMKTIQKRIRQFREEDTKKLERKLRRERDPKTILQLFNIPINNIK